LPYREGEKEAGKEGRGKKERRCRARGEKKGQRNRENSGERERGEHMHKWAGGGGTRRGQELGRR